MAEKTKINERQNPANDVDTDTTSLSQSVKQPMEQQINSTENDRRSKEDWEKEYQEATNTMRNLSTLQVTTLTAFIAVTGGLLALLYATSNNIPHRMQALMKVGGLITTLSFAMIDTSNAYIWTKLVRRASYIESNELKYKLYSSLPGAPKFIFFRPARIGLWLFYGLVATFWLLIAIGKF